jgi:HTH-type transcriptional regulator, glycine betaine synthesis regulator
MNAGSKQPAQPQVLLRQAEDRFIAVWGQMAGAWGVSRTMAEVHALLYISGQTLCTDDVMERLAISRGNASMSLRALVDWNIITRETKRGDRKEYFKAEADVWALFRAIVRERMNREVDPLLASLHEIRDITGQAAKRGEIAPSLTDDDAARLKEHQKRLGDMLEFFEVLEHMSQKFVSPSGRGLQVAATLLTKMPDLKLPDFKMPDVPFLSSRERAKPGEDS